MIDASLVSIPLTAVSQNGDPLALAVMQKALVERVNAARAELKQHLNDGWDIKAMTSGAQPDGTYLHVLLTKTEADIVNPVVAEYGDSIPASILNGLAMDAKTMLYLQPVSDKGD